MSKVFLLLAALAGGLAVVLGAFAAHALKTRLAPELLATFKTAVDYQMAHALALMGVALLLRQSPDLPWATTAAMLFIAGILLFSGSLYGLALFNLKWLGPVTPLGGLCLIAGWACLVLATLRL